MTLSVSSVNNTPSPPATSKADEKKGVINYIQTKPIQSLGYATAVITPLWILPKVIRKASDGFDSVLGMWKELSMHVTLTIFGLILSWQANKHDALKEKSKTEQTQS